jgi:hypothetical protein
MFCCWFHFFIAPTGWVSQPPHYLSQPTLGCSLTPFHHYASSLYHHITVKEPYTVNPNMSVDPLQAAATLLKAQADEAEAEVKRFEAECTEKLSVLDKQINSLVAQRNEEATKFDEQMEVKIKQAVKKVDSWMHFEHSRGEDVSLISFT